MTLGTLKKTVQKQTQLFERYLWPGRCSGHKYIMGSYKRKSAFINSFLPKIITQWPYEKNSMVKQFFTVVNHPKKLHFRLSSACNSINGNATFDCSFQLSNHLQTFQTYQRVAENE